MTARSACGRPRSGKLLWHKLLAPVISPSGWNARPAFVAFSGDGQLVVAAGRRDDPVAYRNGIVTDLRCGHRPPRVPRLISGRSAGRLWHPTAGRSSSRPPTVAWGDTHFLGIEVETGRTRWSNPSRGTAGGLRAGGRIAVPPRFVLARGGNERRQHHPIRCHSPDANSAGSSPMDGPQSSRRPAAATVADLFTAAFSADGRAMVSSSVEWVCVWDVDTGTLRRRIPSPNAHGCLSRTLPRRQHGRHLGGSACVGLRRRQDSPVRYRDR